MCFLQSSLVRMSGTSGWSVPPSTWKLSNLRDEEVAGELDKVHFCGVHWLGAQEALALQVVALAHLLEHEHGLPRVLKERPLLRAQVDELVEGLLFALLHNADVLRQPRPEVEQELVLAVLLLHVL